MECMSGTSINAACLNLFTVTIFYILVNDIPICIIKMFGKLSLHKILHPYIQTYSEC